jgi:hypothetical protein
MAAWIQQTQRVDPSFPKDTKLIQRWLVKCHNAKLSDESNDVVATFIELTQVGQINEVRPKTRRTKRQTYSRILRVLTANGLCWNHNLSKSIPQTPLEYVLSRRNLMITTQIMGLSSLQAVTVCKTCGNSLYSMDARALQNTTVQDLLFKWLPGLPNLAEVLAKEMLSLFSTRRLFYEPSWRLEGSQQRRPGAEDVDGTALHYVIYLTQNFQIYDYHHGDDFKKCFLIYFRSLRQLLDIMIESNEYPGFQTENSQGKNAEQTISHVWHRDFLNLIRLKVDQFLIGFKRELVSSLNPVLIPPLLILVSDYILTPHRICSFPHI